MLVFWPKSIFLFLYYICTPGYHLSHHILLCVENARMLHPLWCQYNEMDANSEYAYLFSVLKDLKDEYLKNRRMLFHAHIILMCFAQNCLSK